MYSISKSTLKRLPLYLTYLRALPESNPPNISATTIAASMKLGEVQVRKDLASISDAGKPRVGYAVSDLINKLEEVLGYDNSTDAVIVGTGKLGKALLDYTEFAKYGLNIVAGFDTDESKHGTTDEGKQILGMEKFGDICSRMGIKIGILTVPAEHAQQVCNIMTDNGITAILNCAPTHLIVPQGIIVQNENIAASLAVLSNQLKEYQAANG